MSGNSAVRNQVIVNRADGGRLSAYSDAAQPGANAMTIRDPKWDTRTSDQWKLERQDDGSWLVISEKNPSVCLQPKSEAKAGVFLVLQPSTGSRDQTWQLVSERTDLAATGRTGWWSLRPTTDTSLAVAPTSIGGDWSDLKLYRATDSVDRLWHHQDADESW
ncbi:RICIN domain-containing protein [Streptomyces klenkii]|uniref:RICIN domain-containing protein n=1 Tax=Streptomyces klenkii TaxID=1420899 RepID=UPI0034450700